MRVKILLKCFLVFSFVAVIPIEFADDAALWKPVTEKGLVDHELPYHLTRFELNRLVRAQITLVGCFISLNNEARQMRIPTNEKSEAHPRNLEGGKRGTVSRIAVQKPLDEPKNLPLETY